MLLAYSLLNDGQLWDLTISQVAASIFKMYLLLEKLSLLYQTSICFPGTFSSALVLLSFENIILLPFPHDSVSYIEETYHASPIYRWPFIE